jgi:hypothetical protein
VAFRLGRARGSLSLKREVILNVFFIYMLCLIDVTLFPLEISFNKNYTWISVNVIPIVATIKEIAHTINDPNMHSNMIKF